jgi:hypothetical protein
MCSFSKSHTFQEVELGHVSMLTTPPRGELWHRSLSPWSGYFCSSHSVQELVLISSVHSCSWSWILWWHSQWLVMNMEMSNISVVWTCTFSMCSTSLTFTPFYDPCFSYFLFPGGGESWPRLLIFVFLKSVWGCACTWTTRSPQATIMHVYSNTFPNTFTGTQANSDLSKSARKSWIRDSNPF